MKNGDYVKVFNEFGGSSETIGHALSYNGLQIGQLYETALNHRNRKIKVYSNGITYFSLYDKNNNLINNVVLNISNMYNGQEFNFDVDLNYGSSSSGTFNKDDIFWCKIKPTINIPDIDNHELYLRIADYGNVGYVQEEDRNLFISKDDKLNNLIGFNTTNSDTSFKRIDNLFSNYFYMMTLNNEATLTFELQLRSKTGQVIQTKTFKITLSPKTKNAGTIDSLTDGQNDTHVRNVNELSNNSPHSENYNFNSLYDLSSIDLHDNLSNMINNSIGFFGLISTLLLLLPAWISSLIFFFFTGLIIITLFRFVRGS